MTFKLGECIIARNAEQLMKQQNINPIDLLLRHVIGDDGDLSESDKAMNTVAIANGNERVLSAYLMPSGEKILVITEWDRSMTTILLPEDY